MISMTCIDGSHHYACHAFFSYFKNKDYHTY